MDTTVHVSYMLCRRLNTLLVYWLLDIPVALTTYTLTCSLSYSLHTFRPPQFPVMVTKQSPSHPPVMCLYSCTPACCWAHSKNCEEQPLASLFLSVRPSRLSAWNNSAPTRRIFIQFDIWVFFEKTLQKFQVSLKSDKNDTLHEDQYTFSIISRSVILIMRLFQTENIEEIRTHTTRSITLFRKSCRSWDNMEKYCREKQVTYDNMAHGHCMLDDLTHTYSQYVIFLLFCCKKNVPQYYVISTVPVWNSIRNFSCPLFAV